MRISTTSISRPRPRTRRLTHEKRLLLLSLLGGLPAVGVALVLLWTGDYSAKLQWTLTLLIAVSWLGFSFALRSVAVFVLRTLANLLEGMREGDYTLRGSAGRDDDALGEVMREANALSQALQEQRLGSIEATGLLQKVMAQIDVAIFAFDTDEKLRLVNERGELLLGEPAERLLGRGAAELGLEPFLSGEVPRIIDLALPKGIGRWELRRARFREGGLPRELVVLSDMTRTLHEEERQAWMRLIQILRHEISNSLAPIHSLAGSLANIVARQPRSEDWEEDLRKGLAVIAGRSGALNRFMASYAKLTRLPKPQLSQVSVAVCSGGCCSVWRSWPC